MSKHHNSGNYQKNTNQKSPNVTGSAISKSSAAVSKENPAAKQNLQANANSAFYKAPVDSSLQSNPANSLPATATLQQRRAHFALTQIKTLANKWKDDSKKQKEFNSYASAMPFMIHANGLGQTAAFYRRKGTEHTYYQLYQLLGDWLSQPNQPFTGKPDLLDGITQSDMETYMAAQIEAMLFLDWVKKIASAFLAKDEDSGS